MPMRRLGKVLLAAVALCALARSVALATPNVVTVQGQLKSAAGAPLAGPVPSMIARLCDRAIDWLEPHER